MVKQISHITVTFWIKMVGQDENFLDLKKQKQEKFLRWNMVFKQ